MLTLCGYVLQVVAELQDAAQPLQLTYQSLGTSDCGRTAGASRCPFDSQLDRQMGSSGKQ